MLLLSFFLISIFNEWHFQISTRCLDISEVRSRNTSNIDFHKVFQELFIAQAFIKISFEIDLINKCPLLGIRSLLSSSWYLFMYLCIYVSFFFLQIKARGRDQGQNLDFLYFFIAKSSTLDGMVTFYRMKISSPAL